MLANGVTDSAVAEAAVKEAVAEEALDAVRCACSLENAAPLVVAQIALKLPAWALSEQIRKWERAGKPTALARNVQQQRHSRAKPVEEKCPRGYGS